MSGWDMHAGTQAGLHDHWPLSRATPMDLRGACTDVGEVGLGGWTAHNSAVDNRDRPWVVEWAVRPTQEESLRRAVRSRGYTRLRPEQEAHRHAVNVVIRVLDRSLENDSLCRPAHGACIERRHLSRRAQHTPASATRAGKMRHTASPTLEERIASYV